MACYHPVSAWRMPSGDLVFHNHPKGEPMQIACGQCVGCRLERSRQWAVRCLHESKMHKQNCFITLTYDDAHLPVDCSLDYSHFQLFMKRLRKHFSGRRIRFYMCGEYGENYGRPHFHAVLFGVDFSDRRVHSRTGSGHFIYRSAVLESLWPKGFSSVADFSFESAAYVARYVMKKLTGDAAESHYRIVSRETGEIFDRVPEFNRMSLKPGIGALWWNQYAQSDVVHRDRVVVNGVEASVPRYYDKLLRRYNLLQYDDAKTRRALDGYSRRGDNTDTRLAVKETVTKARISSLKRSL